MDLQTKLTTLRKQSGLTQLDLAEKLNVSRQAISRWEVGTALPNTDNLKFLSELYGVSVDYLLNDGFEDACRVDENQSPQEQVRKPGRKKGVFIWVAALAAAMIIVIFMSIIGRNEKSPFTPMEDMSVIEDDVYPTETFSIG